METDHPIAVHVCPLCGKPFAQERQCHRHQIYCQKTRDRPRRRPWSCTACNQAKIKCNFRTPCNQCTRKKIQCVYEPARNRPTNDYASVGNAISLSNSVPETLESEATLNPQALDAVAEYLADSDHARASNAVEKFIPNYAANPNTGLVDVPQFELSCATSPALMHSALLHKPDDSLSFLSIQNFDSTSVLQLGEDLDFSVPGEMSIEPMFTGKELSSTTILFSRNQITTPAQQMFTTMLIDMVRAYPLMMTRRETFPPFVHPCCYLYDGCDTFPQSLSNCMGIAQLFVSRTDDTRLFFWRTALAEVRSILGKLESMNKYELFSALQASLLYLIMRAIDAHPLQMLQDLELIRAHETICDYTLGKIGKHVDLEVNDPHRRWIDWIFDESVKRVGWVWFSLNLVYQLRTGVSCKVADATAIMPLPCTKTEWEAQNEDDWKRAFLRARSSQNIQTFGDLIYAHQCSAAEKSTKAKDLENWNAGIDNLGVLLNLAVYMTRA